MVLSGLQKLLDDTSLPRDEHDAIAAAADEIERLREGIAEVVSSALDERTARLASNLLRNI